MIVNLLIFQLTTHLNKVSLEIIDMEKNKSNLNQSVKYALTKNKLGSSTNLTTACKTVDTSLNRNKNSKKKSLQNLLRTTYMVKKGHKKGAESILYKTTICTPETTALYSCISTPAHKAIDKKNPLKVLDYQKLTAKLSIKQNFLSTDQGRLSEDCVKFIFIVNNKVKFEKAFNFTQNIETVKKYVANEIKKKDKKINLFYGLIGLYSIDNNDGVDKMLRTPNMQLKEFHQKQIFELNVKVVLSKKQPSYKNLEFCDFQFLKYLGNGGFSSVFLARCLVDGRLCALKLIKKSSIATQNKFKMLENQKNILFMIDHPRLVDLYYAFQSKNYVIFGLQFCPNGNLYQLLQKRKTISEIEAKFLFSQILEGLQSLHSQKILFRDVKLQNILFDENGNVKITDFGLSKPDIDEEDVTYSYCGSPQYMAPEMLAKVGHSFQIDHYALGIILYQLLYGRSPFFATKKQQIFYSIMNSQPQFPKVPAVSKQVKCLIKGLLEKNPKHRIGSLKGVQQIVHHPWLRGFSTKDMQSPFKIPLSLQNIYSDADESTHLENQFAEDINYCMKEKLFFTRSFVNKHLAQKLEKDTLKLCEKKQKQKPQKILKSESKSKTVKIIR